MKKILSAVFVMTMLIITASITGSVLAADSYQYTPDDGLPVVYVSKTGDVNSSVENPNGKEYATINEAVKALAETGGYVILLEDVEDVNDIDDPTTGPTDAGSAGENLDGKNGGRKYQFPTTSGKKVIIRGRHDLEEFPKIYLRYMCSVAANSEYVFENVHLYFRKYNKDDNDQSIQCGTSKVTFGKEGDPDSIQVTLMENITGSQITINGGTFSIRMATWGSNANVSNVDIVLNGGTLKGITGAHSGYADKIYGTDCSGDFCITVNGGTYMPSGLGFGQPANNKFNVGGDYKLTINGGTLSASAITPVISGKMPKEYNIGGKTIVDILNYNGDKAALETKFKASDWDLILSKTVYVSDSGDDSNAGTAAAPVATYAKAISLMGSSNGAIYVDGTLVLDNVTEATRSNLVYIQGANEDATVVINGDFTLGGSTNFSNITIANGTDGAIVANGKTLVIDASVSTAPNADGTYIDVIAGKRGGYVPVDITILGGTYNTINPAGEATGSHIEVSSDVETITNGVVSDDSVYAHNIANGTTTNAAIELIDFVADTQAAKISPAEEGGIAQIDLNANINAGAYSFAFIDYYLNLKDEDALEIVPELVINGTTYTAEKKAANGWNVASFDISAISETIETFTFFPYGQVEVNDYNKLYCMGITFSQLKSSVVPDYGEVTLTSKGDYVPVLDDYVLAVGELVNTADLVNTTVEELPFVIGTAAAYTPTAASGVKVQYFTLVDGSIEPMIGAFRPYVRVEYFMYAREGEEFADVYPTLKIGEIEYPASEKLVTNKWAVATFNIADYVDEYSEFEFAPYGAAENLNEWNKLYVQKMVFSQQEDTSVPAYSEPKMADDGKLVPYVFNPKEEGLEDHPVIYVNVNGGVLKATDPIESSINSSVAYGSLSAAFTAANASKQVVYLVLVDDVIVGTDDANNLVGRVNHAGNLPSNTNTIIIRGMEKSDGTRTKFMVSRMPRANGPLWFQNIDLVSASKGDTYIALQGNDLSFGTPNGDDNDITFSKYNSSCAALVITFGGDGGNFTKGPVVDIYSGNIGTTLKLSGAYGATTINGDITVNVYGGNLSGMSVTNGHSVADKNIGNVNINISGGTIGSKWELVNNSNSYVEGDINVKISGKPNMSAFSGFTIAGYNADNTTGHNGSSSVDILEYEGSDFEALKAKLSNFKVKFINSVYIKDGGTGDGSSVENACDTFEEAFAACYKVNADDSVEGGRIVVCGDGYTIDDKIETPENAERILITSDGKGALKFASGTLVFNGEIVLKNIKLENTTADDAYIAANGNKLVFETGITGVAADGKYVSVVGGNLDSAVDSVDVTINSGDFQDVLAGGSVTGDVSIVINGGTIHGSVVGGTSVEAGEIGGNTSIEINGGEFEGSIIGGSSAADGTVAGNTSIVINDGTIDGSVIGGNTAANGYVQGTSNIVVNGGKFGKNSAVVASNADETATVNGNASITINSGDFDDMADGQINTGVGTCNDKLCIDYKKFDGASSDLEGLIPADKFDVTVEPLPGKPSFTAADKVMYIIGSYGDPSKGLTKAIPFKITQSASQSAAPIVVSPKQLNLKMDGSDHAIMSLQTVKDTVDTIRFIPNHNPTKGSRVVVDGYNIKGRGVDVTKYKYIEIVYYYTVPEGETPAIKNMQINCFKPENYGAGVSGELVPNKWTTTIIDMSEKFEGKSGELAQYHFGPMGASTKGTDIPVTQYLDIASLTFYSDKPNTTIQGGNAPSAKIVEEEEKKPVTPAKPTTIEDIVVNVVNLKSTVDNSGAFTSAQVTKDGMTVMEYTPDIESAKQLRIEGYNCMGKLISLNEYQYLTMKVFIETERTDVEFKTQVVNCNGGVQDNAEKAKGVTWTADTALVPNEWNTVTLKIAPADPAFHVTRQFHIAPIGNIAANTLKEGEKFYLAEFVLSNKPPKASVVEGEGGDEIVEVEQEVIEESPAIVIEGTKTINSAGNFATLKSTVGEFDGKKVVMIYANNVEAPVAIDGSAIFGNTEQTPGGALSLKKHRYAVISYYYATEDTEAQRIPEFSLLGGRIQNLGNTVNDVVAKGTGALKTNQWATAVIKLSGNGEGEFMSGFTFRPYGTAKANSISKNDVLYIENITFVSNLPQ